MATPDTKTEALLQATQQAVPTGTWSADKIHSTVGFAVPYMAGTFQGTFSDFEARLSDGALRGAAQVASVEAPRPRCHPIDPAQAEALRDAIRLLLAESRELELAA